MPLPRTARRNNRRCCRPTLESLEDRRLPSTFVVLNAQDNGGVDPAPHAGTGTLRQAIVDANAAAGPATITFQIDTGPQTIKLAAGLPQLIVPVVVDGSTQPGFAGPPLVDLDGSAAGDDVDGLVLAGGASTVRDLAFGGFSQNGIAVTSNGNTLSGNYVGTNLDGTAALANAADGVAVFGSNNTIGGTAAGAGNLVSGNTHFGIDLVGGNNVVTGNRVGTNAAGTAGLPNGGDGVIAFAAGNTIGGDTAASPNAGNLISGNGGNGVDLVGGNNLVAGNRIGSDAADTTALGNAGDGVIVFSSANTVGGLTPGLGNVVSGNAHNGVEVAGSTASGNLILGNRIGTDGTGSVARGNGGDGVLVFGSGNTVGGTEAGAGNLVSGNAGNGISLVGGSNLVQANLVGTDATGTVGLGNAGDGVAVFGLGNTVGGTAVGAGNVVSGNQGFGVDLVGGANVVQGNSVGTDRTGTAALGNGRDGVVVYGANDTVGGNTPGAGNLLSGNAANGVAITGVAAAAAVIQGNRIGTDAAGTGPLGNAEDGIRIDAPNNVIGDSTPAGANTVAFNGGVGIRHVSGAGNTILENNVFANGPPGSPAPPVTPPALPPTMRQFLVVVPDPGRSTLVRVLDAQTGQELFEFTAFPGVRAGLAVAAGDLNGDGVPDIVAVTTGARRGGRVRVVDGATGRPLAGPLGQFTAFTAVQGGVSVSVTDFDGDGVPDLVVRARVGGRQMTKVYSGRTGALLMVAGPPRGRHIHRRGARR
jgi:titin